MIFLYLILGMLLLFYVYMTWTFDYWSKRGVPAMKGKFFLGNLPSIVLRNRHTTYDFDEIYAQYKGKTPFIGIFQMRSPRLIVLEPDLLKDVMIRNFTNFHDNEFGGMMDKGADLFFSSDPFTLSGEKWKEKRAEITPAFTAIRLKSMFPLIEDVKDRMIKYIREQIKTEQPFDSIEISAKYTTDVVSNTIFGVDAQSFTIERPEIREMGRRIMEPDNAFVFKMILLTVIPWIKKFFTIRFTHIDVEKFFVNLTDQALKYRADNNIQREDFLDYLIRLQNKKGLGKDDIAGLTISFFSDGFESSSIAIGHVLYELGNNKQVQDKLRFEVGRHTDKDGNINFETLSEMPYLDQVWNETLRMHPPALLSGRICTEDIELEFGGQKASIEKGIRVYIPIKQLHYDSEIYAEPEKFSPERFDPEVGGIKAFKEKGVFMAFGGGPRICLGMKFATLQSKVAIAGIVKNFEISVNGKTAKKLVTEPKEILNFPVGGLWLDFKPIGLE